MHVIVIPLAQSNYYTQSHSLVPVDMHQYLHYTQGLNYLAYMIGKVQV